MQTRGMKTLAAGIVAITAAGAWGGCTATNPTELVPGVLSQMQVPRNLQAITVEVLANGARTFCQSYEVFDGVVELPRTLGVVSQTSPNTVITITIRGYDTVGAASNSWQTCAGDEDPVSEDGGMEGAPRILRRSVQTYAPGRELFVPLPLSYSCFDEDCSATGVSATCKGAQCVDGTADAGSLVDYTPDLVFGTGEPCFHTQQCFSDAVPAVAVTGQPCTYRFLEPTPPAPGLNVRVFYQNLQTQTDPLAPAPAKVADTVLLSGGEAEILSADGTEGFTVLANQQFQLAPGLCRLAQQATSPPTAADGGIASGSYIAITDIEVASACPPKNPLLPLCAVAPTTPPQPVPNLPAGTFTPDGLCNVPRKLLAAPTALYLAVDESAYMGQASAQSTDGGPPGPSALSQTSSLATFLSNPVFARTYLAFIPLTHDSTECTTATTAYQSPAPDFGLPANVTSSIQTSLATSSMNMGPLELEAVMRPNASAYAHIAGAVQSNGPAYNTEALVLFVNRIPGGTTDSTECTTPPIAGATSVIAELADEAVAAYAKGVQTFFVVFNPDPATGETSANVLGAYQAIQMAAQPMAGGANPVTVIDATQAGGATLLNFATVAEPLATCLYEPPPAPLGAPANYWAQVGQLKYTNPVAVPGQGDTLVPYSASCADPKGWLLDAAGRIKMCPQSCADLRNLIVQVVLYSIGQAEADGGSLAQIPSNINWLDVPVAITPTCSAGSDAGAGDGG